MVGESSGQQRDKNVGIADVYCRWVGRIHEFDRCSGDLHPSGVERGGANENFAR
ncbi:hypothetical protein D3C79_1062330 [compost metagenome]